jgi:hypothetical protein
LQIYSHVFFIEISLDSAIIAVKRLYKSSLKEISEMYADSIDYRGLYFWFEDAKEYIKEINKSLGSLS